MRFGLEASPISLFFLLIGWAVITTLTVRMYRKQNVKIKYWKMIFVIWVGLFSFSFNASMFQTIIKIPLLPLGVWILYFFLRSKEGRWERYRRFAWLGFLGNFIFLGLAFVTIGFQHVLYPPDKLSTYISNVDSATIVNTHPSAEEVTLQKDILMEQLPSMEQTEFFSDKWYGETYMSGEENQRKERFPYQVFGVKEKWGSATHSVIFIEEDGKGLLIATPKKQYYFRSDDSFLEGVNHE
ncbi:hypothetical protein [Bacillus sp. REN16]|uniref:hypothetical protein n=1 Tax=Bacillus sp. REN16 TaxID=2887296 RepID=UPI001E5E622B|nr:hypothetical protein [Bacillus sp. REN16]MCC3358477.1 hypothetical protein [Bacillus sp. REN16]